MPKFVSGRPDTQVIPEPALEKRTRRTFKAEYKLRMIAGSPSLQAWRTRSPSAP